MNYVAKVLSLLALFLGLLSCSSRPGAVPDGGADASVTPCTSDKACQAQKQVCDPLQQRCVDCLFDAHCDPGQHCKSFKCAPFTPCSNSLDCKAATGKPICSKQLGECVECDEAADCTSEQECIDNACVSFTPCKSSKDCTDQVCMIVKGKCVDCLSKDDCAADQVCVDTACKLSIPCKSDKQCINKDMLCDKAAGVCKTCLQHSDCPKVYHCKAGDCVIDTCLTGQSKCTDKTTISYCNDTGDGFDSPKSCGPLMCVEKGWTAKCTTWECKPPCSGTTDTCVSGACKCGSQEPCSGDSDACVAGVCKCGTKDSCGGATDTCISGVCMCGSAPTCNGTTDYCAAGTCQCGNDPACSGDSNTCVSGTCMCGSTAACSGATDTCASGLCKCGSAPACSGAADTCFAGACLCGTSPKCNGVSDTCASGACMCGTGAACAFPKICVGGGCVTCTKDTDCDDALSCTTDTCATGVCTNTLTSGSCLIGGACHANGAVNTAATCTTCDTSVSTSQWTVTGSNCLIDSKCYVSGAKHANGCWTCDPTKSKTAWSPLPGCSATHVWSKAWGTYTTDYGNSVATDGSGNVYLVGAPTAAGLDLGGGVLPSKGSGDIILASYSPSGAHRWSKRLGGASNDQGSDIATDSSGNIYVTGYFQTTVDLGGGALKSNGSADIFVASFTSSGLHRWSKSFGGTNVDMGFGITVDGSGNVYTTGKFYDTINCGGGALTAKGNTDLFIVSYTSSGAHRWSKSFGGTGSDYGRAAAVDKGGNVYIVGGFSSTINLGTGHTSKGLSDAYVASFTSAGAYRWSVGYGAGSHDYAISVAVDGQSNVYASGVFDGSVSFGGTALVSKGSHDVFVASYTAAGGHRWSKSFGNTNGDYGYAITVDSADRVYVAGSFRTSIDLGGGLLVSKGNSDIFVAGFTSSGAHRWSYTWGAADSDRGRGLATSGQAALYVVGVVSGVVDFGGGPLPHKSDSDIFLLKLGL
jgi:Beta-propeller repeat